MSEKSIPIVSGTRILLRALSPRPPHRFHITCEVLGRLTGFTHTPPGSPPVRDGDPICPALVETKPGDRSATDSQVAGSRCSRETGYGEAL